MKHELTQSQVGKPSHQSRDSSDSPSNNANHRPQTLSRVEGDQFSQNNFTNFFLVELNQNYN